MQVLGWSFRLLVEATKPAYVLRMLGWQLGQVVLIAYLTVELRVVQVGTVIA